MGFRNLKAFKVAFLAEQIWRVLKNPKSLVAETLMHKYFKNTHILEAKVSSRPSLIWRSLHSAMDILKEGLYWRLGSRDQIKIWEHKWIPIPSTYKIKSPVRVLRNDAKFKDLIDTSTGE